MAADHGGPCYHCAWELSSTEGPSLTLAPPHLVAAVGSVLKKLFGPSELEETESLNLCFCVVVFCFVVVLSLYCNHSVFIFVQVSRSHLH